MNGCKQNFLLKAVEGGGEGYAGSGVTMEENQEEEKAKHTTK